MQPRFIAMLSQLLDSKHIDVSYFAAGIAAHLLSDGPALWNTIATTRNQLLNQLARAVINWQTPQGEMVAYRSFHPFFPLLRCADAYPVQLWAAWAIHHVCTKNREFFFFFNFNGVLCYELFVFLFISKTLLRYVGSRERSGNLERIKRLQQYSTGSTKPVSGYS